MTGSIRVMLRDMPQMLREILEHAFGSEMDMEVTREVPRGTGAAHEAPDVILLGTDAPGDRPSAASLLARWPNARIISIESRGRHACMYELRPHKIPLGQLSPEALVGMVRTAVRGPARAGGRPACDLRRRSD